MATSNSSERPKLPMFKRLPFRKEKNRMARQPAYEAVEIENSPGLPPYAGVLKDISTSGAHLHVFDAQSLPRTISLRIPALNSTVECTVKWRKGNRIGVEFNHPIDLTPMPQRPRVDRREIIAAQFRTKLNTVDL